MPFINDVIQASVALFVIINAIGNIPIFISLTADENERERQKTFLSAIITGFILLLLFTYAGMFILSLFHINLEHFEIAGGIILIYIAVQMITGHYHAAEGGVEEVGAVPIGCPLLVGPGAITTGMVLAGTMGWKITLLAIIINLLITIPVLLFAEKIHNWLGVRGSRIIAKIMSIFIASIAVQLIANGIIGIWKTLI
jgi:multiple antibiotic resistance protein